ncbi:MULTISPECIES: DUF3016 domain-containing protein [unclassified Pseudoalteromonas]|uniref:DUF3016 domain-containing protein n=1 Tax=unclassified Pseudoalteromonas TaxID=194690 RepID=UPI003014C062
MKRTKIMLALLLAPLFALAGEAQVSFKEFKEYRDVRPSNETRGSYHQRVEKQLRKHVEKLAEQLPEGSKLSLHFDEIDLAGDVRFGASEVRVIKSIYFPRLTLSYKVTNSQGDVLTEGKEVKLKDMAFMDRITRGLDRSFQYEKRLLTEWFEDELVKQL